ncbi:MAG TPA: 3'-5' exonuclease, partial [Terriglobales bacterium]
ESTLARLVAERLAQVNEMIPSRARPDLARLASFAAGNLKDTQPDHPIVACSGIGGFPRCCAEDLPPWNGVVAMLLTGTDGWRSPGGLNVKLGFPTSHRRQKEELGNLIEELKQVPGLENALASIRDLPMPKFNELQWEALETFARLLPRAAEQLQTVFAERQQSDYIAVSMASLQALSAEGSPTALAQALGHSIEHLLVDEFQDTSVSQVKLLEAITAGWKPRDGRTLFLVGDPMQSIYRFRQAEVGSFIRVALDRKLGRIEVEPLHLTKNFRSRKLIVDWVNGVFQSVFGEREDVTAGAVKFAACEAAASGREKPARIEVYAEFGTKDEIKAREANRVLNVLRDLRVRGEKAAILVRSRSHLFSILGKLREAASTEPELRFQAVEIDELSKQAVIGDLRALTHALLHFGNRVAWLAILRAPWCGLSLADMYALVEGADKSASIWELLKTRQASLSEDGQSRLGRVLPVLEDALSKRGRLRLQHWVESTWISLNGPACLKSNRELEDAAAYFELLDRIDEGGDISSLTVLEKSIEKLFSQPDPDATDAIQVMTIHKAKGLEFDAVLLPALDRFTKGDDKNLLIWDEREGPDGPELLMAPMRPKGGDKDPIYDFLRSIENERDVNEMRRLLYVAVTRAKHELYLFGGFPCDAAEFLEKPKKPGDRSMLSLLWPVVEGDFVGEASRRAGEPLRIEASADAAEQRMLRRLPLQWAPPEAPASVTWHPEADVETVDPDEEITYDWAGERARRVGTIVHAILQRIAQEGLERWNEERITQFRPAIRSALANEGVSTADMPELLKRAERALVTAITDKRGRWILEARVGAQNEYPLTGSLDGELKNFVIDRTFVADGVRWIVDYKTGLREGGEREAFLDNEVVRYRDKLALYARIMRTLDPTSPIKIGLYYPLMNGWREWDA